MQICVDCLCSKNDHHVGKSYHARHCYSVLARHLRRKDDA